MLSIKTNYFTRLSTRLAFLFSSLFFLLTTPKVYAQCPVCIVTVGGGMLIAEKLGVDDLLVAIWISALNTVISYWAASKIKINFLNNPFLLSLIMLITTLVYFQFTDQLFVPSNTVLGIDKILLGMLLGIIAVISGNYAYSYAKKRNHDKAIFPYSKVVFPFSFILLITLIFKFTFNL